MPRLLRRIGHNAQARQAQDSGASMSDAPNLPEPAGSSSEIILYQSDDKQTQIDVRLEGETVWLSQKQMADLFQTTVPNINIHIRNVFDEGELREDSVIK